MPFYQGKDPNFIPVYECSYQFSGFLIQAYEKLVKNQYHYYVFIGDDLILFPYNNENNILNILKVKNKSVFITNLFQLNSKGMFSWEHSRFSSNPFKKKHQTPTL